MIQPSGHPSEAYATYYKVDLNATKQTVFAGRGNCFSIEVQNNDAAAAYLQVFDALAASVTVGTTTPGYTLLVPANALVQLQMPAGAFKHFATGMVIALTTSRSNSTNPGAAGTVHIHYRLN
jgi:hypothetical protein